ncbi:phytanoyl-CoA dioxygenase family protein [Myroides odoratimimus]|uniref:phytanoyl-CoA dioxygenase family protein n=1 Tax=Myroides odoratimimus TaxID=76832 RepID=UPI0024C062E0|nr:phytanoyl-CoA dioxygenase family protein [Myroides odoratimimus]WHT72073.1 phytanoyl-CoA dioxygenase family protein [Myroides odoratimimus]WHU36655.1 phytanoyl-CoA dioxygenase family protein [Myroides odoratimimus]
MYLDFEQNSYLYLPSFFTEEELTSIELILNNFHKQWLIENEQGYKKVLINSHSLTSSPFITKQERLALFQFIAQAKLIDIVESIFPDKAKFLNTQLFFDPYHKEQKNYWHRDIQYTGLSIEEQQEKIKTENVVHFRIPLKKENGIEIIPATHRLCDMPIEEDTRLSQHGRHPSDALERGQVFNLNRGDLFIFSANSIHRGLYGDERFSFDIIYCDDTPAFNAFIDPKNQPTEEELALLNNSVF